MVNIPGNKSHPLGWGQLADKAPAISTSPVA